MDTKILSVNETDDIPVKYIQPDLRRGSNPVDTADFAESIDFIDNSHLRIWYNTQLDRYDIHQHGALEIIQCIDNIYTVTAGKETYTLNQGDILIIPPHMLHRLLGGVKGSRFIMLIDTAPMTGFHDYQIIAPLMNHAVYLNSAKSPELHIAVSRFLQHAAEIYFEHKAMWEFNTYSYIMSACAAIAQDYFADTEDVIPNNENSSEGFSFDKFSSLLTYINEHYMDNITLETAAEYVGFSKYYFSRLFKKYTGLNFYEYLTKCRIHAAQELLTNHISVTETAFQTGFHSPYAFSRAFRKETGISPSKYISYSIS